MTLEDKLYMEWQTPLGNPVVPEVKKIAEVSFPSVLKSGSLVTVFSSEVSSFSSSRKKFGFILLKIY